MVVRRAAQLLPVRPLSCTEVIGRGTPSVVLADRPAGYLDKMTSVRDVIARLRRIDDELAPDDGAAVFNRMYLTVTETVADGLAGDTVFVNPQFMEQLDVTFASLWIEAYDADPRDVPTAWAALFERRHDRAVLPIQFALAGMNSHIEHDLVVAVIQTCQQLDNSPENPAVHHDYEAVNRLLAATESQVRRWFLTEAGQEVDTRLGPVVHIVNSWNIDKARDVAWVNVEAIWAFRHIGPLVDSYRAALARTVGMASRCLLTPTQPG
jgi:hypothetical protein